MKPILKRLPQQTLFILFALTFLLFFTIQTTSAQAKSFYWERFDVDMALQENGDIRVTETQTLIFSGAPFTFGFGTIPTGGAGNNDNISNISVSENGVAYIESGSNGPGTFEVSRSRDEVRIDWYFPPALGRHTYQFSYTIEGGVIVGTSEEGSGDQIFWKAIPPDLPARVDNSTVTIRLPEGVQPQRYTGTNNYLVEGTVNGSTNAVRTSVSENGRLITYELQRPLYGGDLFEVRVQWPHGILDISTPAWQQRQQRADAISLVLGLIGMLLCVTGPLGVVAIWYTRGRDPELGIVVPDYVTEPPGDLPPAVAGTLIDERADLHDIISTLVDLARRGYLTISEEKRNHVFTRTEKPDDDLRPFEKQFLKDIFRGREQRSLNSLRYKFADRLPKLRKMLYEELTEARLVPQSPESVRNRYTVFGWLALAGAFMLLFGLLTIFGEEISTLLCIPFPLGITGVVMLVFARFMPAKTQLGAEEAAKWNAFKTYLQNIERYTNLEEAADIFEKYLAYATAFGIERSWIRKFSQVSSAPPPPWYFPDPHVGRGRRRGAAVGGGAIGGGASAPTLEGMSGSLTGGLESMSSGLTRMLNSTNTILNSTRPSSSGSSGSFSGGFSGGGSFSSGGGGSRGFG